MTFAPKTPIGRYEIISVLGKGGMGEVYLAHDPELDRKIAIKVLSAEFTMDSEKLKRFIQEAKAVSALNHPNILTVYEIGKTGESRYIATEFIEGETLRDVILRKDSIQLKTVLKIGEQVAEALSAAHQAGIIHRDIKPENIMVRNDGYIKVLDFGLAKLTEKKEQVSHESETKAFVKTDPGIIMGTASYMSPEQARGKQVDEKTDIWSLGVVLYELLAGKAPFTGETISHIIVSILENEPKLLENVPDELQRIVRKSLTKDQGMRYQTARDLLIDLKNQKRDLIVLDELDRSIDPNRSAESLFENKTRIHEQNPTEETNFPGKNTETAHPINTAELSTIEFVVTKAKGHKLFFAAVAAVLIGAIFAAAYFTLFANRNSERIDSVAVLPFENLSDDKTLEYLSDGLSESLIDRLSQLPQLKVISRSSSFKFRGKDLDVQDVADKLGVRAIVMGSIVKLGDDLIIRVEITDARENKQLWGERFNRKSGDILTIQNEIAQTVSEKLKLRLTDNQTERLASGGTNNSDAFQFYLNGLVESSGPDDVRGKALENFEKAIELDPEFALAHTEIAFVYIYRANGSGNPHELIPKAKASIERALKIDEKLAKAHVALALIKEFEFDWQGAEAEYKKAIELNPNLDIARNFYAFFLSIMDRQAEALVEVEKNRVLDPINVRLMLENKGLVLTQARRFDEALEVFNEANETQVDQNIMLFSFGYVYAGKGLYKEAGKYYKNSVDNVGGEDKYSQALVYLAATYAKIPERRAEAIVILNRLENSKEYVSPATLAVIYAALDDNDKAMQALEKAYIERDLLLRYIRVGYEYDSLRNDQRFKDLLQKTRLAE